MSRFRFLACLFFSFLLLPAPAKGQDQVTQKPALLQGIVIRSSWQSSVNGERKIETALVRDAIVSFVEASDKDPLEAVYTTIASTVSDSEGSFEIAIGKLEPTTLYAIRARGAGDVWSTYMLGTGSGQEAWLKPTTITVGSTPSNIELRKQAVELSNQRLQQVQQRADVLKQQEYQTRRQISALEVQKLPPVSQGQVLQLRDQLASTVAEEAQQQAAQQREFQHQQRLQQLQQQAVSAPEPGGHFGVKRVLFATDRAITTSAKGVQVANVQNANGQLSLGQCEVAVERQGELSSNFIRLISDRDADRYFTIQKISVLGRDAWWRQEASELKASAGHDALMFIHGYNSSFAEGCRRAAQIAYDIKFDGPIFLYSWPSRNTVLGYMADEDASDLSGANFTEFLKQVLAQKGLRHLHIIAHSMGNRVLCGTLFGEKLTHEERARLGQIIFAAADVNRLKFDQQYQPKTIGALHVTLYASTHDQALWLSKFFHSFSRLGDAKPIIEMKDGMDSVDASAVDTSLLGHSYIGESRSVLFDVGTLILANTAPDQRLGVIKVGSSPKQWWVLNP